MAMGKLGLSEGVAEYQPNHVVPALPFAKIVRSHSRKHTGQGALAFCVPGLQCHSYKTTSLAEPKEEPLPKWDT